jgi:hypothetical protein
MLQFQPMRALEFITGHVIYNLAYTYKFQLKTTLVLMAQPRNTLILIQATSTSLIVLLM